MVRTGFWAGMAWVGAVSAATMAAAAQPTGANSGAPVQPGSWGRHGWQAGAGATPTAPSSSTTDVAPTVAYRHLAAGETLPSQWQSPTYTVSDWHDWGLTDPGAGRHWVRYYDDAVLVDGANKVAEVRQDAGWARTTPAAATATTDTAPVTTTPVTQPPRITTTRTGPNTVVTTETRDVPAIAPGSIYQGQQVLSSTPGTVTTTTTTTTEYPAAASKPASPKPSSGK